MKTPLPLVVLLVLFSTVPSLGQLRTLEQNLHGRTHQLESQARASQPELRWLQEHPVRLPSLTAAPGGITQTATPPQVEREEEFSWERLQAEMKKLAWTKGDFKIVPYGWLWGNLVYSTARTTPGSYTLYVPSADVQGEDEFIADGRTTRVGLAVSGPRLWAFNRAESGGKVELDFQGSFSNTENRAGILLRHAYVEIKNDEYRLLLGQTWDVISPLVPGTIMYSVFWGGGNIGYRRGQLRGERYLAFSDVFLLTLQGSLNQNIVSDFTAERTVRGETASWPLIQGRAAVTLGYRGQDHKPMTFGVSGHIGEQGFDVLGAGGNVLVDDVRRRTWSINADVRIPITYRSGFQGEFFSGENLGVFLGGVGQGIDAATRRTIRSTGGWLEVYYDWFPDLHSHLGYGLDDPLDGDVTTGRTYNQFYFGNLVYDVTKEFKLGFEVTSWRTLYATARPGDAVRFEFMAKYGF